jgi:hypothetical protein
VVAQLGVVVAQLGVGVAQLGVVWASLRAVVTQCMGVGPGFEAGFPHSLLNGASKSHGEGVSE